MSISLETAKKLNWLWKDENKIEWIQTFIKIADKDGNIVPFILTDEQRKLWNIQLADSHKYHTVCRHIHSIVSL
jgi:hypothetical protein